MFRNTIYRTGLLLLCLSTIQATPGFGQELQPRLQLAQIDAPQQLDRINAREEFRKYLESATPDLRPVLVQGLITALPSYNTLAKMTVCKTLEALDFFWAATNQEEAEATLYKLYQTETNVALKMAIDRALMRAKGLYRDAMKDFNNDKVDQTVAAKFQRVYETYPKSRYAAQAHFYLGLYPLRSYAVLKREKQSPALEEYVTQSNGVLQKFLEKAATVYPTPAENVLDAHYFRALNFVLLNQVDMAIKELKAIEENQSEEDKIYIYQFFYSSVLGEVTGNRLVANNDVVDKFLDARKLAKYTRDYLEANSGKNFKEPSKLREFTEKLKLFKEEKW